MVGLIAAIIAATASIIVSLIAAHATMRAARKNFQATVTAAEKNFETALAIAQKNLDNAAKNAFETARGASSLQDYRTGQELIANIQDEFAESAVQRSVKKGFSTDLHAFKLLADRLKVASLTELSRYAGQLLGAYWTKTKRWEDYEQQEKPTIKKLADKASQALDSWASNPQ